MATKANLDRQIHSDPKCVVLTLRSPTAVHNSSGGDIELRCLSKQLAIQFAASNDLFAVSPYDVSPSAANDCHPCDSHLDNESSDLAERLLGRDPSNTQSPSPCSESEAGGSLANAVDSPFYETESDAGSSINSSEYSPAAPSSKYVMTGGYKFDLDDDDEDGSYQQPVRVPNSQQRLQQELGSAGQRHISALSRTAWSPAKAFRTTLVRHCEEQDNAEEDTCTSDLPAPRSASPRPLLTAPLDAIERQQASARALSPQTTKVAMEGNLAAPSPTRRQDSRKVSTERELDTANRHSPLPVRRLFETAGAEKELDVRSTRARLDSLKERRSDIPAIGSTGASFHDECSGPAFDELSFARGEAKERSFFPAEYGHQLTDQGDRERVVAAQSGQERQEKRGLTKRSTRSCFGLFANFSAWLRVLVPSSKQDPMYSYREPHETCSAAKST